MESRDIPSTQGEVKGPMRRAVDHWPSVSTVCDQHNIQRMMRIHHKRMKDATSSSSALSRVDATEPVTRTYSFMRESLSKKHLRIMEQDRVMKENQSIVRRLVDILTAEHQSADLAEFQPRYQKLLRERQLRRRNIRRIESQSIMEENLDIERRLLRTKSCYNTKQMIADADEKRRLAASVKRGGMSAVLKKKKSKRGGKGSPSRRSDLLRAAEPSLSAASSMSVTAEALLAPVALTGRKGARGGRRRPSTDYSPYALGGGVGGSLLSSSGSLLSDMSSIGKLGPLDRRCHVAKQAAHLRDKLESAAGAPKISPRSLDPRSDGLDGDELPPGDLPGTAASEANWRGMFDAEAAAGSSPVVSPASRGGVRIGGRLFLLALSIDDMTDSLFISGNDSHSGERVTGAIPLDDVAEHMLRRRGLLGQVDPDAARTALVAAVSGDTSLSDMGQSPVRTVAPLLRVGVGGGFELSV